MADSYPVGTGTLTDEVDCPFCIAKAGEPCWDYSPEDAKRLGGPAAAAFRRTDGQVHLCRIKPSRSECEKPTGGFCETCDAWVTPGMCGKRSPPQIGESK